MITLYKLRFLLTSHGFKLANKFISNGQLLNLVLRPCFASGRSVSSYRKDINGVSHCKAVKGHLSLNSFSTVTVNRLCWKCGSSAELFFCSSCNVIQPPDGKTNYFDILNWWVKWMYGYRCYCYECIIYGFTDNTSIFWLLGPELPKSCIPYLLSLLKSHNIVIKQMIQQLLHDQTDTILLYIFQLST